MAQKKSLNPEVITSVKKYSQRLKDEGIQVQKVLIFGSYAKRKHQAESDIDVCIVSDQFGQDEINELQFLLKQTRGLDERIEPIPVSSRDFKTEATPLITEIKHHGVSLQI